MPKKVCRSNDKPFFVLTARKFWSETENITFTAVSYLMQSQNREKVWLLLIPPAHVCPKCRPLHAAGHKHVALVVCFLCRGWVSATCPVPFLEGVLRQAQ